MGNGVGKLTLCFTAEDARRRRRDVKVGMVISDALDDLGHSFCYIRPELNQEEYGVPIKTTFKSLSGAAISANTSTPLSTSLLDVYSCNRFDRASGFESSTSFASIPLQPIPRNSSVHSGPLFNSGIIPNSAPLEKGFMSGPIERASMSDKGCSNNKFLRSYSHGGFVFPSRSKKFPLLGAFKRALSRGIKSGHNSIVAPIKATIAMKGTDNWIPDTKKKNELSISLENDDSRDTQNLQWAQGKAGEDRVHVVVSEDEGWVFVGIYDGFNGPDAPDFLLTNLYSSVHKELKGILWEEKGIHTNCNNPETENQKADFKLNRTPNENLFKEKSEDSCSKADEHHNQYTIGGNMSCGGRTGKWDMKTKYRGLARKWEENQKRWRCQWDLERLELDRRLMEQRNKTRSNSNPNQTAAAIHEDVLKALSLALKKTEESYLDIADMMVMENPELALMGSCVLVMVMKEDDLYIMNVGDSQAIVAQKKEPDLWSQELEKINEETFYDLQDFNELPCLKASQLTMEHSTSIEQEVSRIRKEHPDDASALINDRVKGSLKVTRAFGAGFLKQPNWNNALLEMFRINYVGSCPYINCVPWLHHHKLTSRDQFVILSSDGLYQYFTNEEAVYEVQLFLSWSPEGDPAQHLVQELLFRAAKRAGMDFNELLEIPQGDRRRYHDDVSIIIVSLEGRIWRSSV